MISPRSASFAFRVRQHIVAPVLARPGDFVLVQPGQVPPVLVVREAAADFPALGALVASGALQSVTLLAAEATAHLGALQREASR